MGSEALRQKRRELWARWFANPKRADKLGGAYIATLAAVAVVPPKVGANARATRKVKKIPTIDAARAAIGRVPVKVGANARATRKTLGAVFINQALILVGRSPGGRETQRAECRPGEYSAQAPQRIAARNRLGQRLRKCIK
jgi:hypothetical protein